MMTSKRPRRMRIVAFASGATLILGSLIVHWVWAVTTGPRSLHAAARRGDAATVERMLRRGRDPDKRRLLSNSTPLIEAALGGHLEVIEILVNEGADIDRRGDTFQTAIHFAAAQGDVKIVEFLLAKGARHSKALHSAARGGKLQVADILIAHGVDINEKGVDERTPLEVAVTHRQTAMVKSLLAAGADVNSQSSYGCTPLHVAALNDDLEVGRILLEHGADPTLQFNGNPVRPRSDEFRKLLEEYDERR